MKTKPSTKAVSACLSHQKKVMRTRTCDGKSIADCHDLVCRSERKMLYIDQMIYGENKWINIINKT
jgi:hypothetical protein